MLLTAKKKEEGNCEAHIKGVFKNKIKKRYIVNI